MGKNTKSSFDLIIIGAGASGIVAAITAARANKKVLLLEHKEKIAKKIPATGNGKCNFTNEQMESSFFRGNISMFEAVYAQFKKGDTIEFFQSIGIYPKSKSGYYYPNSEQASSIVKAFQMELTKDLVHIETEIQIEKVYPLKYGFDVQTNKGAYHTSNVLIATGLLASPKLGSDGSIFPIIKELGHHFTPIVPALCGYECEGMKFKKVSGVRAECKVSVSVDYELVDFNQGEVQLTDYGISGIPVFQVSHEISYGLYKKKVVEIELDFMPNLSDEMLLEEIDRRTRILDGNSTVEDLLNGLIHEKLIHQFVESKKNITSTYIKCLTNDSKKELMKQMKHTIVRAIKPRDYEFAQVCAGGIRDDEVDINTLESNIHPGLFFAGEILNVDGICGGYNLQWAWSSGYVASKNICCKGLENDSN